MNEPTAAELHLLREIAAGDARAVHELLQLDRAVGLPVDSVTDRVARRLNLSGDAVLQQPVGDRVLHAARQRTVEGGARDLARRLLVEAVEAGRLYPRELALLDAEQTRHDTAAPSAHEALQLLVEGAVSTSEQPITVSSLVSPQPRDLFDFHGAPVRVLVNLHDLVAFARAAFNLDEQRQIDLQPLQIDRPISEE